MPTRQDILFSRIAMKNRLVSLEEVKKCFSIQGELEKLGVQKPIGEVFQENGLLYEDEIEKLSQAVKVSENILQQKVAQKKFFEELNHRREELVDSIFDEGSWDFEAREDSDKTESKEKEGTAPLEAMPPPEERGEDFNPFEVETEEFEITPQEELKVVMRLQKLQRTDAKKDKDENRVGKFEILQKIGQGGMSEVFKARDTTNDQIVALKLIKPDIAKDKTFIERFHREAKHLKKFNHENIIKVYDAGMIQDRHYLAMEYVRGETLSERAQRGRLSIPEVGEIVKQIAAGLSNAHEKLIVHRDIKLSNILLTTDAAKYGFEMEGEPNFSIKIADFGLARSQKDTKVTQANQFMGTAKYLSPEHIQHGEVSEKSDLFALGIITYELLAGTEPFPATSSIGYLHANVEQKPAPIHKHNPDVSEQFEKVVMKLLEKDPSQRYSTPALIRDLERLEKTFWGGQKIAELQDRESAFYIGNQQARKKRLRRIFFWSSAAILLLSAFIALRIHLNKSSFASGKKLVWENPQAALRTLEGSRGWGVDDQQVDRLLERARHQILLQKARRAQEEGRWLQSIRLYKKAQENYPDEKNKVASQIEYSQYMALMEKALAVETSNYLKAARLYQEASEILPNQKEAQSNLAALVLKIKSDIQKYKDLRQFEKAKEKLEVLAEIQRDKKGEIEKKIQRLEFEKILYQAEKSEDRARWMEAYSIYGKALKFLKKTGLQAKDEIQKIKNKRSQAYENYLFDFQRLRGEKAEKAGNLKKALKCYQKALNLREDRILRDKWRRLKRRVEGK